METSRLVPLAQHGASLRADLSEAHLSEALTLPGVEVGPWMVRNRFDAAAASLADRHYSREVVGSPQVGGPGFILVLVSPCERAAWISKRNSPDTKAARVIADGLNAYRCTMFRNEGAGLASELIVSAMEITEELWGPPPADGWATYVDKTKIASANPGFCFKQAGWTLDREWSHPRLVRLRSAPNPATRSEHSLEGTAVNGPMPVAEGDG
jgi:hypothetical protein